MFNFKFLADYKNLKLHLECSTNKSSDSSVESSIMNKMIWTSLGLSTLISIWKFLIIPLLM
jgi:hypothetical protein